ncbi:MAG: metallophosphoesterase family protein [Candidatus Daviesbacteria bacterium]|nr:metallophosphoesterase family protein [Candidatus Daviesbacteria bacterium]
MFKHSEKRKSAAKLPFTIFRLFLSLVLFLLLGIALIQAFKYFNGTSSENDPFTQAINEFPSDPKQAVVGLLTSEDTIKVITGILSFSPNKDFKLPLQNQSSVSKTTSQQSQKSGKVVLKFALVSDSHKDVDMLKAALAEAKSKGAKFVIGLGDYTDVGTITELQTVKNVFETAGLPYYVVPGDHDLWDARDKDKLAVANFSQVFGSPYQAFTDSGIRFILLYNSDNYDGVDNIQQFWLEEELGKKKDPQIKSVYVFLHEPLVHPSSEQVMGSARKSDTSLAANSKIQSQAKELLNLMDKAKVGGVFAGDIHAFTTYTDMETNINMVTVGALTKERNTQSPRFAIVDVYDSGSYNISDIEINP